MHLVTTARWHFLWTTLEHTGGGGGGEEEGRMGGGKGGTETSNVLATLESMAELSQFARQKANVTTVQ